MLSTHRPPFALFAALAGAALVGCAEPADDTAAPPADAPELALYVGTLDPVTDPAIARSSDRIEADLAATVEVWSVDDHGSMARIGRGDVIDGDAFMITTPATPGDRAFTLVQAFDAEGDMVLSAVVEETGRDPEAIRPLVLDAETTVETQVWRHRIGIERSALYGSYADLRTWIDADLAMEVYDQVRTDEDGGRIAGALAEACASAEAARIHTLQRWGWEGDALDLYWSSVSASQALTDDLLQGESLDDWERYLATVDAALARQGAPTVARSDAGNSAALAFQLSILGRPDLEPAVMQQALRSSMRNEAFATAAVLRERSERHPVADPVWDAADRLWTEVYAAEDLEQGYAAFDGLADTLQTQLTLTADLETIFGPAVVDAWLDGRLDTLPPNDVDAELIELLDGFRHGRRDSLANGMAVAAFWYDLRSEVHHTLATSDLIAPGDVALATELALHTVAHAH